MIYDEISNQHGNNYHLLKSLSVENSSGILAYIISHPNNNPVNKKKNTIPTLLRNWELSNLLVLDGFEKGLS